MSGGLSEAWDKRSHRYIMQVTFSGLFLELSDGLVTVHYFINK